MNIVKTTAPISIEELKKYFVNKDTFYVIDYQNSALKGKKLLTYLSNLEIPSDIDVTGCADEEFFELLQEYMSLQIVCNIQFLEKCVIHLLKEKAGILNTTFFSKFIEDNSDAVNAWASKIYSLSLFNLYAIECEEFKQFVEGHELDETDSLIGVNFVSILKHQETYDLFQKVDNNLLKFYKKYFNEYMFKGKNLYHYWANENNPMFLLTYGIASGNVNSDDYINSLKHTTQELENASLI